jgi:biopolymer transport protein ExbB/TolQ
LEDQDRIVYYEFPCVNCKKNLKVSEEHIGRKVRCPYCHQGQVATAPEEKAEDPLAFLQSVGSDGGAAKSDAAGAGRKPPRPEARSRKEDAESGTDVNALKSGLIGLGAFVAVYAIAFPLRSWYVGALLWDRGWVQFAEVILATWAGAILFIKSRKLSAQRDSMFFDLLPESISTDITPSTVDAFIAHIRKLPVKSSESFLVNRVLRGLEHFGILGDSGEVAGRLATQSEIDGNAVSSSYALVKVFVWAIPILGFIGTVQGIGQAVGAFSATMSSAGDISALKDSFGTVTSGLGTAFDTTLLALVLSIFIMFPMSSIQKAEQGLLNWVDEYCNENLLKRIRDLGGAELPDSIDNKALQAAVNAALAPHHAELRHWGKKLEAIGETLNQQIVKAWNKVDERMQAHHDKAVDEMTKSVESYQKITEQLRTTSDEQAKAMADLVRQTKETQSRVSESMQTAGDSVARYFTALEEGVSSLNRVLANLGEKQVVVDENLVLASRRKSGWLSLFGRRNGR